MELARKHLDLNAEVDDFLRSVERDEVHSLANPDVAATVDAALHHRRQQLDSHQRVKQRTAEIVNEQLRLQRHADELKELEDTVRASAAADDNLNRRHGAAGKSAVRLRAIISNESGQAENEPYVADFSPFLPHEEAAHSSRSLKLENELLRKCLNANKSLKPDAFRHYLRDKAA